MELTVTNVNAGLVEALWAMKTMGVGYDTRNGPVLAISEPVLITYRNPQERVLIYPNRGANPYFHLMESLWMLQGRNDVAWIKQFNSKIGEYSDDGIVFNGAYGHRWREHFAIDQIEETILHLKEFPNSRRAVITMWDAEHDLNFDSKDLPCNTHIYFDLRGGKLNMTVCNRSNDMIWGTFGANAVHMSILQEVMASSLRVPVGCYNQFTNNLHLYLAIGQGADLIKRVPGEADDPYARYGWKPYPLMDPELTPSSWWNDLDAFMAHPTQDFPYLHRWFFDVARPMAKSWFDRKAGLNDGTEYAKQIEDPAWSEACLLWIGERS